MILIHPTVRVTHNSSATSSFTRKIHTARRNRESPVKLTCISCRRKLQKTHAGVRRKAETSAGETVSTFQIVAFGANHPFWFSQL